MIYYLTVFEVIFVNSLFDSTFKDMTKIKSKIYHKISQTITYPEMFLGMS